MKVNSHEVAISIEFNKKEALAIAKLLIRSLLAEGQESTEALERLPQRQPEAFSLVEELLTGIGKPKMWSDFKKAIGKEASIQRANLKKEGNI